MKSNNPSLLERPGHCVNQLYKQFSVGPCWLCVHMHFSEQRCVEMGLEAALGGAPVTWLRLPGAECLRPVVPPIDLQHTVYNFCYKSSEHADYRLHKPWKNTLNWVPGLKLYTTVTPADILKLPFMAGAAMSLPDPACARLRRHYCQTSSTLLAVMGAPFIELTFICPVQTPSEPMLAVGGITQIFFLFVCLTSLNQWNICSNTRFTRRTCCL